MHNLFREELGAARGISEFVVAQNIDIRGFSDWSLEVDSAQTALFIKKVYATLIDRYFADASFVKPTGDGLLVVTAFEEAELKKTAAKAVSDAMKIVESFHALCEDDDMINFPVPRDIGIGIARGAASRLASPDRTLDYSGRVLNLASRLMDLARPRGVVLDDGFGLNLLPDEIANSFHRDSAILKGIAPTEPLPIHCWPDEVVIPPWHKRPLEEDRWEHKEIAYTLKDLNELSFNPYRFEMNPAPLPASKPEGEASFPAITPKGNKSTGTRYLSVPVELTKARGAYFAAFDVKELAKRLEARQVKPGWKVTIKISYRIP